MNYSSRVLEGQGRVAPGSSLLPSEEKWVLAIEVLRAGFSF